jgi:hypothetical protein
MMTMDKVTIYRHTLNMDNEKGETCNVIVKFNLNEDGGFDGFLSIWSDNNLYSEDLAHLEEWVIQGKEKWII